MKAAIKIFTILFTLHFSLLAINSIAQAPDWDWAKSVGGKGNDCGKSVAMDATGNSYITGTFSSPTITFGSTTLKNADSTGNTSEIYLVKYDPTGNVLWAKSASGLGVDYANFVTVDPNGNIYIAGYFSSSTISFGNIKLTNTGMEDIFLAKYDAKGNVIWATSIGGTKNDEAKSVAVDATGNIYITGIFSSPTITLGSTTMTNAGENDIFLVKYDISGNVLWAKSAGGTDYDYSNSVAVDTAGNSYITGYFNSPTITFGSKNLMNAVGSIIYIAKYDKSGNVIWAKSAGESSYGNGNSITVDFTGNIYITGGFLGTAIFGSTVLTNAGSPWGNVFLAKFDANGNIIWAKAAGGTKKDRSYSVVADASGNAYITGYFKSPTITFDNITLTNSGGSNIFLAKYDANGNVLWVKSNLANASVTTNSLNLDATGNIYITGTFISSILALDSITLKNSDSTGNTNDIFLAKLGTVISTCKAYAGKDIITYPEKSTTLTATGGTNYSWNTGGKTSSIIVSPTITTTYTVTVTAGNCTSSDAVKVTVNGGQIPPNWVWAKSAGGSGYDIAPTSSISVDVNGNAYIAGWFKSSSTIFGTTVLTNSDSTGNTSEITLVKYDKSGILLWAKSVRGKGNDYLNSITVDKAGNIYITGFSYSPSITFDTITLTNSNSGKCCFSFLSKYDPDGKILWAKNIGGNQSIATYSVTTDIAGNVYITGTFYNINITFGSTTLTNADKTGKTQDIFIAKYDITGNILWSKNVSGINNDYAFYIVADTTGNIYISGKFYSPAITLDTIILYKTKGVNSDIFLAKYSDNGNILWAKNFGGKFYDWASPIAVDLTGNIYITDCFNSTKLTIDSTTLTNAGSDDIFLAKYDANGKVIWAKSTGGTGSDWPKSIAVDGIGNPYLCGYFESPTITFDNTILTNTGKNDIFIAKYDTTGNILWATSVGGPGVDIASSVAMDATGNAYIAGYFYSPVITFGSNTLVNADLSGNSSDIFLAKLGKSNEVGIEKIRIKDDELMVYPNPSDGRISIEVNNSEIKQVQLRVINIMGQIVMSQSRTFNNRITQIDLSTIPAGIYNVVATASNGKVFNTRIIVI
ncbi:MAG: SBBP repeat-containing protein [Bacteroidota bacterium]|nr:SBBP repeat-containing protein [Bacteroidota bacterium]